ncbi:MAG: DUF3991 and toprim domain-containing protein [Oscillospiraceae bacterium]|nr:DUF3991 and toprim domain-containing protein [Oscillospiraceae bacterium]
MLYTDEQIAKAKSADLAAAFQRRGYTCEKAGKDIHVRGFGGLYVGSPTQSSYYCHSKKIGGGNAVVGTSSPLIVKEKRTLEMPEKASDYRRVFAYLIQQRKISPDIIRALISQNILYQDVKGNAVFVHLDNDGNTCGAELVGTLSAKPFKGIAAGTHESVFRFFKGGNPDTAYIFESTIDAMSFVQLYPELSGEFVSMAGLKDFAVKNLAERGMKIISCVDNDEAGRNFNGRVMSYAKVFSASGECSKENVKDFTKTSQAQIVRSTNHT